MSDHMEDQSDIFSQELVVKFQTKSSPKDKENLHINFEGGTGEGDDIPQRQPSRSMSRQNSGQIINSFRNSFKSITANNSEYL